MAFVYHREIKDLNSSVIRGIWLNEINHEALVALGSRVDHDQETLWSYYIYSGVDWAAIVDWVNSDSLGGYYNSFFQREYGPADKVSMPYRVHEFHAEGNDDTIDLTRVDVQPDEVWSIPKFTNSSPAAVPSAVTFTKTKAEVGAVLTSNAGDTSMYVIEWKLEGNSHTFVTTAQTEQEAIDEISSAIRSLNLRGAKLTTLTRELNLAV